MTERVVFIAQRVDQPVPGAPAHGASAHVAVTIAALEQRFDVLVAPGQITTVAPASRGLSRRLAPPLLRGARQDVLRLIHDRAFTRHVIDVARSGPVDAVYERDEYMSVAGARVARALDVPLVLEVNGLLARDQRVYYRSPLEAAGARLERWKLRRADAVVTVSPGLAELLVDLGASSERIHIVPNAVPDDALGAGPRAVVSDSFVVGFVGHLMRWHAEALELLIAAAPTIIRRMPEVRFEIIGDGPDLQPLRARAREAGVDHAFTFRGAVAYRDVPDLVRGFDVGVIPAVFDYAFPVKLVQMGAAGLPVVAPASRSLDQQVRPGTEYMPFYPDRGPSLADALVAVLGHADLRARLGSGLHQAVRERFTVSAIAPLLEAIVRSVRR